MVAIFPHEPETSILRSPSRKEGCSWPIVKFYVSIGIQLASACIFMIRSGSPRLTGCKIYLKEQLNTQLSNCEVFMNLASICILQDALLRRARVV